jgi:hypothetical protein
VSTVFDSVAGNCPLNLRLLHANIPTAVVMDPKACKGGHFPPTYIELRLMVGWNVSPSQARHNTSKNSLDSGERRASPSVELVAVNGAYTACSLVIRSALPLQGTVMEADSIRSLVV